MPVSKSLSKPPDEQLILPNAYVPGKIGVVTVLFNSASVLEDFFTSLDAQTYRNFVVYCVDNASRDGSAALCSARGEQFVALVNSQNVGVAAGNNHGIRAAINDGCEYVLLLNNDVVFGPDLFQQLLDGLTTHQADMTTPLMYYYEPNNMVWCAGGTFNDLFGYRATHDFADQVDNGQLNVDRKVGYTPTCCVLVKRSLFERIGIMDELYFVYWDDTDWMLRARKAGASLWFLHSAKLWHKVHSLTGKDSDFKIRFTRRNHAYYFYKHMSWLRAWLFSFVYCSVYRVGLFQSSKRRVARLSLTWWKEGEDLYTTRRSAALFSKHKKSGKPLTIVYGVFKAMGDLLNASPVILQELNAGHRVKLLLFPGCGLDAFVTLIDFGANRDALEIVHVPLSGRWPDLKQFFRWLSHLKPDLIWVSPHAPQPASSRKIPFLLWTMKTLGTRHSILAGASSDHFSSLYDVRVPVNRDLSLMEREHTGFSLLKGEAVPNPPERLTFVERIRVHREEERKFDLLIHPGANAANRKWPLPHFAALVNLIPASYRIAVLGLPADIEQMRQIMPVDRGIQFLTGTLEQAISIIASARVLFAMDSGNVHFANFLDQPAAALFGNCDPVNVIGNWGSVSSIYEMHCPIQPCRSATCSQPELYCLNLITPKTVASRLLQLLDANAAGRA